jgi:glutaredoxin 2
MSPIDDSSVDVPSSKTFTKEDIQRVNELKSFARNYLENNSLKNQYTRTISTMLGHKYIDIFGKITSVTMYSYCNILHLMDGTSNDVLGSSIKVSVNSAHLNQSVQEIKQKLNRNEPVFVKLRNIFMTPQLNEVKTIDKSSIEFLPLFCLDVGNFM